MSMKKLQTEIDRVLKKVGEGVDTFNSILDKINTATVASQKEKHEQDLKKEIKKLQRLRDQIKTWLSSNEIKDKQPLLDNRKLIEAQMERFKVIEREMKTKAYSKEGLSQKEKLDPKEKEKLDLDNWLTEMVDSLNRQNETHDFELESKTPRKGKKAQKKSHAVEELERKMERNNYHVKQLELIRRLLENDVLDVEMVNDIQDNVTDYVENNQESDFVEDEYLYDDLNLEGEEGLYMVHVDDHAADSIEKEEGQPPAKTSSRAATSPVASKASSSKPAPTTPTATIASVPVPISTLAKVTTPVPPKATPAPAPTTPGTTADALTSAAPVVITSTSTPQTASDVVPPPPSTGLKYAQAAAAAATDNAKNESAWVEPLKIVDQSKRTTQQPMSTSVGPQPLLSSQYSEKSASSEPAPPPPPPPQEISAARLPRSLADLGEFYEKAKERASRLDLNRSRDMLEISMKCIPDLHDSERPYMYQPRNPTPNPTSGYPTEPLFNLMDPMMIEKFGKTDEDLLFFMFYYQTGTYQQYLAAKQLKSRSWRFHTEKQRWFQRSEEPKEITNDYEQGKYEYFECGDEWQKRTKSDFRFEYKFLEEA